MLDVNVELVVAIITCSTKFKDLKVTRQKKVRKRSKAENYLRIIHFHAISKKVILCYQGQVLADLFSSNML